MIRTAILFDDISVFKGSGKLLAGHSLPLKSARLQRVLLVKQPSVRGVEVGEQHAFRCIQMIRVAVKEFKLNYHDGDVLQITWFLEHGNFS